MPRVNDEVILACRRVSEFAKEPLGSFECPATYLANEMTVRFGSEMVRGWPVTEVGMNHDAETLKFVKIAIDGGEMHVGCDPLYLFGQLLRGAVRAFLKEAAQEDSPRGSGSTSTFAK